VSKAIEIVDLFLTIFHLFLLSMFYVFIDFFFPFNFESLAIS